MSNNLDNAMDSSETENLEQELSGEILVRNQKLEKLKQNGIAYPNDFRRNIKAAELYSQFDNKSKAEIEEIVTSSPSIYKVAGRMMTRRQMGKANFITLQDVSGSIQLYVAKNNVGEEEYNNFMDLNDLGDIIGAVGTVFKTNTGELSLKVTSIKILTKSLRPLASKFHGLTDQETRYRQRYLDLISNESSRETFVMRSKIIEEIRQFFIQRDFMEVETPMLQVIPGGAEARPFITHHNALNIDMFMRISPELYLKRLVVGGFERVFEINRSFRNEGLSVRHNPEFTMIEYYQAYADVNDLIVNTELLFEQMANKLLGKTEIKYGDIDISLKGPYIKLTMIDAILKYGEGKITYDDLATRDSCADLCKRLGGEVNKLWKRGKLINEIFELVAEEHLIQPTFITHYPAEISPLARRNDLDPDFTDRFEFFIGGREIGNGFSELNDSRQQAQAFDAQVIAKDAGDDEAMFYDHDYVVALEQGLPPTAGQGIGIDRVVMLFTNSPSIKDVILFPTMRVK